MKKISFVILFIFESLCFYAIERTDDLFVQSIKQKDYSSSLEHADNAAYCLRPLIYGKISWDEYVGLMVYADSVQHQHRDSIIINGINYLVYYGMIETEEREYEKAISLHEVAASLTSFLSNGVEDLLIGINNQLAINHWQLGNYDKAISYSERTYQLSLQLQKDTLTITTVLDNLGLYNYHAGNYEIASKYLQDAYQLSLSLPTNHPERIRTVSNLALILAQIGLLDLALSHLQTSIAAIDTDFVYLPTLLNNLCEVCSRIGKYDMAIEYGERGLQIYSESDAGGLQNINSESLLLNNLSIAYYYLNNTSKAIQYAEKALALYKPIDPNEHALLLSNLGMFYSHINPQKAHDYYLEAVKMMSPTYFNYPQLLNNIGLLFYNDENYDIAKTYYEMALESINNFKSIVSPTQIAVIYSNLSLIYAELGEHNLALRYCEDAIDIAETSDVNTDIYALLISNKAVAYTFRKGKEKLAYELWKEVMQLYTDLMANRFDYLTESERILFWQKAQAEHAFIPSFVYEYYKKHPHFTSLAYNNALLTKGMLLQSTNHVRKSIEQSGDTLLQQQWEELLKTQQMLTSSVLPRTTKDSLTNRAESLETWIMKNSRDFRQSKEIWEKDWTDVKNVLKDGEVAIEFIDFYSIIKHDKTEHIYAALLVRPNDKRPIFVPLCAEEEIHSQLGNPTQTYDINGSELYELIWSQITPYLAENNTIYFAPSGLLHQLNIELLPMPDLRPISDVYNLVRVSSTRELLLEHGNTSFTSATLYGGLIYDMDTTDMIANSSIYDDIQYRSFSLSDTLSRKGVAYLPGTKKEIENISLCLQSTGSDIRMFTGAQGNEESFKAQTGGNNNILHIATHGFFFEDEEVNITDLFKPQMQQIGQREQVLDPLLRSGLLLAGSNYAFTGHFEQLPKSLQDGVLYAKEISLLDLSETELVVLSACETGQGDITSEGVFGLQRAFKMAGVQTIIMSLWKVNDQATQLLMTEFYNNWIGKQQSKREAFRNAQNSVRTRYEEPEYWAGFVMLD